MKNWAEKRENHEQVTVGEKVSRFKAKMKKYLEDLEGKIEARGTYKPALGEQCYHNYNN